MSPHPLLLVAAGLVLDSAGRALLAERPVGKDLAGLWEFPGGKVDPGETPEVALVRELEEEIGLRVDRAALEPLAFTSFPLARAHLLMPLFRVRAWTGTPEGREGQRLAWVAADDLESWPMPPADKPLLPFVRKAMRGS